METAAHVGDVVVERAVGVQKDVLQRKEECLALRDLLDPLRRGADNALGVWLMLIPSMTQVTGKVARSRVHVVLLDSTRVGDSEILTLASQIASKVICCDPRRREARRLLDRRIISGFITLLARRITIHEWSLRQLPNDSIDSRGSGNHIWVSHLVLRF